MTRDLSATTLREFVVADTPFVARFLATHLDNSPPATWEHALQRMFWLNPSLNKAPAGWILEHRDDGVVGFLGNVLHPFHVVDHEVHAAATAAWCVAPDYRSLGLLLAEAFLDQEGADVLVSTTANPISAAVFSRMGFTAVEPQAMAEVQYWVTSPARFVRGAALHFTRSRTVANVAVVTATLPFAVLERARGHHVPAAARVGAAATLSSFGPEWRESWAEWRSGLITGVRTPDQLAWRLGENASVVAMRNGDEPLGYVACRVHRDYGGALTRLRVVDLWCDLRRGEVVRALADAALQLAKESGCACLEVTGMNAQVRNTFASLQPRVRRLASVPYYIRPRGRELREVLSRDQRWHATGYDGDTPFTLEGA